MKLLLFICINTLFFSCKTNPSIFPSSVEIELSVIQPTLSTSPLEVTFFINSSDTFYCSYHFETEDLTYRYIWSDYTKAWDANIHKSLINNVREIDFDKLKSLYHITSSNSLSDIVCSINYKKDDIQKSINIVKKNEKSEEVVPNQLSEFIYRLLIAIDSKNRELVDTSIISYTWPIKK